eukprot:Amastigsp_a343193_26.p3 type:complete len:252 gc:universal Amastigsp_a343193_26:814-59(-)
MRVAHAMVLVRGRRCATSRRCSSDMRPFESGYSVGLAPPQTTTDVAEISTSWFLPGDATIVPVTRSDEPVCSATTSAKFGQPSLETTIWSPLTVEPSLSSTKASAPPPCSRMVRTHPPTVTGWPIHRLPATSTVSTRVRDEYGSRVTVAEISVCGFLGMVRVERGLSSPDGSAAALAAAPFLAPLAPSPPLPPLAAAAPSPSFLGSFLGSFLAAAGSFLPAGAAAGSFFGAAAAAAFGASSSPGRGMPCIA